MLFGAYLRRGSTRSATRPRRSSPATFANGCRSAQRGDEFDQLADDAQPDARSDRGPARKFPAGVERCRARPSHATVAAAHASRSSSEPDDNRAEVLEEAIAQLDQVLSLFAAILRIAEVESGETRRYFTRIDLSALTTELAESYAPALQDRDERCCGRSNRSRWSRVIANSRRRRRSTCSRMPSGTRPLGTIIRLTLVVARERVCLQVVDNGPGVPTADLPRMVKTLHAPGNKPKHRWLWTWPQPGQRGCHAARGRLMLKNNPPGLSATIELPLPRRRMRRSKNEH